LDQQKVWLGWVLPQNVYYLIASGDLVIEGPQAIQPEAGAQAQAQAEPNIMKREITLLLHHF